MFFHSRSQRPDDETARVADHGNAGSDQRTLGPTQPLMEWRRAAQGVNHAWNVWLAAEPRDGGICFRSLMAALAGEESAATELERVINPTRTGPRVKTINAHKSGPDAP